MPFEGSNFAFFGYYDVRHVVGGFTVKYSCTWSNGYYETFRLDGPLAEINWTMKKPQNPLNTLYSYLANKPKSVWS